MNELFVRASEFTWLSCLLRLALATVFGGTLGIERTRKGRAAGMRTYGLVSVGSALIIMTGQYINLVLGVDADPTRMAAQVISGIGFLGAGTILLTGRHRIMGLTTAAGLWASACIGIAVGSGFYMGAFAAYIISFFLIALCDNYRAHIGKNVESLSLYILLESKENVTALLHTLHETEYVVSDLVRAEADVTVGIAVTCSLRKKNYKRFDRIAMLDAIHAMQGVVYAEETT